MRTPWRVRFVGAVFTVVAVVGVLAFAPSWLTGTLRNVAAYDAGTFIFILACWLIGMHRDPGNTACRAAVEDPGRNVVLILVLGCVGFGLAAATVILGKGPHVYSVNERNVSYGLALFAIVAGWVLIHTMFVFRYAHVFYFDSDDDGSAQRGLIFPGTDEPSDYDFAYFSFVIGMTSQVSDVQIKDSGVRRLALIHGLISFGYNTTIVALVINIVSGLLR